MDDFGKKLSLGIIVICLFVFALSVFQGNEVLDALMFAVALAVAAIPEALSSIVTIVLAMGTTQMAREHAIIKNINSVESLGCVSVICSDKTGTLTKNRMSTQQFFMLSCSFIHHAFCLFIRKIQIAAGKGRAFFYNQTVG